MRFLLLSLCLIFIGCGQGDGQGTVSRPSEFKANEKKLTKSVSNQFFQVSLKQFMFKTDEMKLFEDFEFQKESKFEYYKLLSGYDFFSRQLAFPFEPLDGRKISTHVESFSLVKRKVSRVFSKLSPYHQINLDLRELQIHLEGHLDIDLETIKNINGLDIVIWNQYKNTEAEIASISSNQLEKSNTYKNRYNFSLDKKLPFKFFHELVRKNLRLIVRLELKKEEPTTQFFYEAGNKVFIKKFKSLSALQDFLRLEKKMMRSKVKTIVHNLDRVNRNEFFYYFVESNQKELEDKFPLLKYEERDFGFESVIEPFDEKYTRREFIGQIVLENWHLNVFHREVSGQSKTPLYKHFKCSMKFQRIEQNVYRPIAFEEILLKEFKWKGEHGPRIFFGNKKVMLALDRGESLSLNTPSKFFQKAIVGRLNKHSDCPYRDFDAFRYYQPFVYDRKEVTKRDIVKLRGKLRNYFIPWEMIYWSEPISNIGLFTE